MIERILELGAHIARPGRLETPQGESDAFVALPNTMRIENVQHMCPPNRIERRVTLQEPDSFAGYVNRFKTSNTLIFCNVDDGACFVAMLDYHSAAPELKPAYCKHWATFKADETPEWTTLCEKDKVEMNQVRFAEFLEENTKMFREPSGADLLEMVQNLHGHKNARFENNVRLDNGAHSCAYTEDVTVKGMAASRGGSFELPNKIKAGAAVYVGGEQFEITLRLKTRIENRQLVLFYEIAQFADLVRASTLAFVKQIGKATEIVPFLGQP